MRHIKLFEEYLEYSPGNLTLSGHIPVYHFTDYDMGDFAVLDPRETINKRNQWSTNDYKRSDFPRVFYFTDIQKTERMIKDSSKFLYTGIVNGDRILDVNNSIKAYQKNKSKLELEHNDVFMAIDNFIVKLGLNFDILFSDSSLYFDGVYYEVSGNPVINLFVPLEVEKIKHPTDRFSMA